MAEATDLQARLDQQDVQIRALQLLVFALLHHAARTSPPIVRGLRRGLELDVPGAEAPQAAFARQVLARAAREFDQAMESAQGDAADQKLNGFVKDLLELES